jgi:hypothetical protein
MNAADTLKLVEQAKSQRQSKEAETKAAAEAEWLANGITRVEQWIQHAAKNEFRSYKYRCKYCPDFVVEHFKDLGFKVQVINSRSCNGNIELIIRW